MVNSALKKVNVHLPVNDSPGEAQSLAGSEAIKDGGAKDQSAEH